MLGVYFNFKIYERHLAHQKDEQGNSNEWAVSMKTQLVFLKAIKANSKL